MEFKICFRLVFIISCSFISSQSKPLRLWSSIRHSVFETVSFGQSSHGSTFSTYPIFDSNQYKKICGVMLLSTLLIFSPVHSSNADQAPTNEFSRLKKGLREVDYLLDHWDEKTTYCNFGEFQRELLDTKNKEKLMEAAAKGGLLDYDKSDTMNVVCKRDPQVVRAFLGLTSDDNPNLVKADLLMRKPTTLDLIDPDSFDEYIEAVDVFARSIAEIDGLSYNARSDFSSTETFSKDKIGTQGSSDYLEQTKKSVIKARDSLAKVVNLLGI
eukprot:gene1857-3603_t